jgi:hypothetical protein
MESYPGQTRLYVVVGCMLGLMIGVFMHSSLLQGGGTFRLAWLLLFAATGAVMGKLLVVIQAPSETPSAGTTPESEGTNGTEDSATTRFFKLQSGVYDHDELRRLRVRSVTMPMSPPDSEVTLQVREYDLFCRVPVLPGVLEKLTLREVYERALSEANARAPKVPGERALELVSFHSEGPLAPDGRSPLGWTFYLVDGASGLGCRATSTDVEIALHFHTAATFSETEEWDWVDLEDVLTWVETDLPDWGERDLRIRVHLPDDYIVYSEDPLRVADIDIHGGGVLNSEYLAADHPISDDRERFRLPELLAWTRGEHLTDDSDLAVALGDPDFSDGLRTFDTQAMERAAIALERGHGVRLPDELVREIQESSELPEKTELVHILARCPGGRSASALYQVGVESEEPEITRLCQMLHNDRRLGVINVPEHPLDPVSFLDIRRRMGRGEFRVVPLRASYKPESDFFPTLEKLGFRLQRKRLLSGDANLLVGAQLQSEDNLTELILTSTPLPVPCHILHIVGDAAAEVERALNRTEIGYPPSQIVADVHSEHPPRVHRASLYVTALRLDQEDLVDHLVAGAERGRRDPNLRRAVLHALSVQSAGAACEHLEAIAADPTNEDQEFVTSVLKARALTGSPPSV